MDNTVTVSLFNSSFKIVPGQSINLSTQGTSIVISCNALTRIDTEGPLEWKNEKLYHKESGVTAGPYGQATNQSGANVIKTIRTVVDKYGHVTDVKEINNTIRDYVEQRSPDSQNKDRPILLAEKDSSQDDTNVTRKGKSLTYNNSTKTLNVGNLDIEGTKEQSIVVRRGNLVVVEGTIIGKLQGEVTGTATPKIHLAEKPEYGGASTNLYGHVVLVDTMPEEPERSSNNTDVNKNDIVARAASPFLVHNYVNANKLKVKGFDSEKKPASMSGRELTFTDDFILHNDSINIGWTEL